MKNYTPIYQLPYCCVPAALQWIFYRRNLPILNQEDIGAELGLRLPMKGLAKFQNPRIIYTDKLPRRGYGTQIHLKKYSINKFFQKYKIPLQISELKTFSTTMQLQKFIQSHLLPENDLIARIHTTMFDDQKPVGHFSLITNYHPHSQKVTIGDPNMPFFRKTDLQKLLYGMSDQIDGIQRGIYVVQSA